MNHDISASIRRGIRVVIVGKYRLVAPSDLERTVIKAVMPGLKNLSRQLEYDIAREAPIDTGFLQSTSYADVNPSTGVITCGAFAPYAIYVSNGHYTPSGSHVAANPFLLRALTRNYGEVR